MRWGWASFQSSNSVYFEVKVGVSGGLLYSLFPRQIWFLIRRQNSFAKLDDWLRSLRLSTNSCIEFCLLVPSSWRELTGKKKTFFFFSFEDSEIHQISARPVRTLLLLLTEWETVVNISSLRPSKWGIKPFPVNAQRMQTQHCFGSISLTMAGFQTCGRAGRRAGGAGCLFLFPSHAVTSKPSLPLTNSNRLWANSCLAAS